MKHDTVRNALVTLCIAGLMLGTPGFATATVTGKVAGVVRGADGRGLEGVRVVVRPCDSDAGVSTTTKADGSYQVTGLKDEVWNTDVEFVPTEQSGYLGEFYGNVADRRWAQRLPMNAESVGIDATLERLATVRGTVIDSSGKPVKGARVDLEPRDELRSLPANERRCLSGEDRLAPVGVAATTVYTDAQGRYEAKVIEGEFVIGAECPSDVICGKQYFMGGLTRQSAPWQAISADKVFQADLTCPDSGEISGTVYTPQGHVAAGALIEAVTPTGEVLGAGYLDHAGQYTVAKVVPGAVKLRVTSPAGGAPYWGYLGGFTLADADSFDVPRGKRFTVAQPYYLTGSSAVTGTVVDTQGKPVIRGRVQAYSDQWSLAGYSEIDPGGTFTIRGLPQVPMRLRFINDDGVDASPSDSGWFPAGATYHQAHSYLPSNGEPTVVPTRMGAASGRIYLKATLPIARSPWRAHYRVNLTTLDGVIVATERPGGPTRPIPVFRNVPVGRYKLQVVPEDSCCAAQWWTNAGVTGPEGDVVEVTDGARLRLNTTVVAKP